MKISGPDGDKLIPRGTPPLKEKEGLRKSRRSPGAERLSGSSADKVKISARGKEVYKAKEAASKAPDLRRARVDEIRKALEDGSYRIDAEKVAEKILKENLNL